jgi:meso-butanediol dehydrogenase/(S,S)-butanediol dehydrogenase/diacetyl reductase
MTGRLHGHVALVSGSTRGIGRSIAELFAAEGASVGVAGRTAHKGRRVVDRIHQAGGDAEFFDLDVTSEDSVRSAVQAVVSRFGALSTLVNNAAPTSIVASTTKPMVEYTTDEWNAILVPSLTGNVFWATKYAWPHLVDAEHATIVNISSGASTSGHDGISAYTAAKGGMNSLTRAIAVEGAPLGIRCNAIVVGRVVANSNDSGQQLPHDRRLIGHPMQIASTALFLASSESSFITGELVTADGGLGMAGAHNVDGHTA